MTLYFRNKTIFIHVTISENFRLPIFGHNLQSANARWPITVSKDTDFRLVYFQRKTCNWYLKIFISSRWHHRDIMLPSKML